MYLIHKSSGPDEIDVPRSATVGNNAQRQALIPIMQQTPRLLARTRSSPSPRRLRLERDTATNCDHLALDHVPSPRVQQVQVRLQAAWKTTRPLPAEWCKVCILVVRAWPSQWLVCVSCVLTAEQRPACLVQHALVPLERFTTAAKHGTMKSSSMFSHSVAVIFTPAGTSCKCDVKPPAAVKMSPMMMPGHNEKTTRVTRHCLNGNVAQRERNERNTLCVLTVRAGVGVLRRQDERRQAVVHLGVRLRGLGARSRCIEFCAESSLRRHCVLPFVRDVECFVKSHMTVRQVGSCRTGGVGPDLQSPTLAVLLGIITDARNPKFFCCDKTKSILKRVSPQPCKQKAGKHQGRMARSGSQAPSDPFFEK